MMSRFSYLLVAALLALAGCGSDSEVTETPVPPDTGTGDPVYTGPAPQTQDIQSFKINLWDNISSKQRCGACHNESGQSPKFARFDDVNLAYGEATGLVDLQQAGQSKMVQKVLGGHNCWTGSPSACGDLLTTWIGNWAQTQNNANSIELQDPTLKDPGQQKEFPSDATLFANTVYPLTKQFCSNCHASDARFAISPYFADSDLAVAYQAAKAKIDLNQPEHSRFYLRLGQEFHNCWSTCSQDAATMLAAITEFADQLSTSQLPQGVLNSKALTLLDGIVASGGSRFEQNAIAKYEFKTGTGPVAYDTSGVSPSLDLTFAGDVSWLGGWGIQLQNGRVQGSVAASRKLYDMIGATGEFSIETWIVPGNVSQEGPARIISYSGGRDIRNFTLGQTLYNYNLALRQQDSDLNGMPMLSTRDADEVLQASLQHVVWNFDPVNGRKLYVNGVDTGLSDPQAGKALAEWDPTFALVLGNETSGDRPWAGAVRFLAIHNRVLTPEQIKQNFDVGVGERFYLLFSVSHLVNIPRSYIWFEVSQYDNYSYLFKEPKFISLDSTATPSNIPVQGMRIGVNGAEVLTGQSYANLAVALGEGYQVGSGQALSRLGTVMPLTKGAGVDEFFLTFERIGEFENVRVEAEPPLPPAPADLPAQSRLGLRLFAEINATMAQITGVSSQQAAVLSAYNDLKQQLPTISDVQSFVAAQQMAVSQLAIKYCNSMVEDNNLMAQRFPGFNVSANVSTAYGASQRPLFVGPLLNNALLNGLTSQAQRDAVSGELDNLIDRLSQCGNNCASDRSKTIAKASCAAVIGSAVTLLQ